MTDYEKMKFAEIIKALTEEEQEIAIANLPREKMFVYLLKESEKAQEVLKNARALLGGTT